MAYRYRLYPTAQQSVFMAERHCADARFVWNLAVEQFNWGRAGRSAPGPADRMHQLAEARQEFEWLRRGSSAVQQQALGTSIGRSRNFSTAHAVVQPGARSIAMRAFVCATPRSVCTAASGPKSPSPNLAGCGFSYHAPCRPARWAWRGLPAIRLAAGMSASPGGNRRW